MLRYLGLAVIVSLASVVQLANGYRILCIFPSPAFSHQSVFRGLTLALNKRGHELVVATPNPINDPTLANYTEIDISFEYDAFYADFVEFRGNIHILDWFTVHAQQHFSPLLEKIYKHSELRKLYAPDSGEKFDLLIAETLFWEGTYPLASRFNVPTIGISSLGLSMNGNYGIGNPVMSYGLTNWETGPHVTEAVSFWQRVKSFITIHRYHYWYQTSYLPQHEAIAKKYLGKDIPGLVDLSKNISLIFVNQQRPISYAEPSLPKVIEIGGFHVSKDLQTLPKELQKILDEATNGFVYMSLGTNFKSSLLKNGTLEKFRAAFSRLPYKVLWKFEEDVLPGKPDNVHIMKWIPQQGVLAHPNAKVFVYQGGLQSTEEAIHHAVPLVGLPIAHDQDTQVNKLVSLGVAKKLEIKTIEENELVEAISTVATDPSYKRKMIDLRSLIDDKPHDPLETAIWWTEHVIRHGGAPQFHSVAADRPWYVRQDMDIVACFSVGFVIFVGSTLILLYWAVKRIFKCFIANKLDTKKEN